MHVKDMWIKQMSTILKLNTDLSDKVIEKELSRIFDRDFKDTEAQIYNNYDEEIIDTTLSKVIDWIQVEKPYIAESGAFFKDKNKVRNLNSEILKKQMEDRAEYKKSMYKAKEKEDHIMSTFYNIAQLNEKKRANSGFGAEGESSSFLYNQHSALSVTSCGRGQISVACQCYENFFSDYVKFKNMDECYVYICNIMSEKHEWQYKLDDVINIYPTEDDLITRFLNKFEDKSKCDTDALKVVFNNLGEKIATRVYYKSNMRAFLKNYTVTKLFRNIALSDCEYLDPNNIPKGMEADFQVLGELFNEFVNYKYQPFRYEDRSRYDERDVIIIMDTDSNIIYFGDIFKYITKTIIPMKLHRNKRQREIFETRILNMIAHITTTCIRKTLDNYLGVVNVRDEDKKYIKMKNEFYFSTVIVTHAKKSYIALVNRREADVYETPEIDVKGVNFFKSTTTERTSKFIYDEVLLNQLLMPKSGRIDMKELISKIKGYEEDMINHIKDGDIGYLKRSIKVKSADAYKNDPLSVSSYKSVYVWNKICSPEEIIELPSTIVQVKVNLYKKKNLALLSDYPEIYDKLLELFETNEHISKKGIKSIALPYGTEEVPEWMKTIIDAETIAADNMKLFAQLNKPLGLVPGQSTYNGSTMKYYSNIVRI